MSSFPTVEPNGSLMLAWQVKHRHVLVVGGGDVAAGRVFHLLNANAKITVISPTVCDEIAYREAQGQLTVHRRAFHESDLGMYETTSVSLPELETYSEEEYARMDAYLQNSRFELVLVAIDDPVESKRIYYQCKRRGLNVNIADVPPLCDFYFGAVLRRGPLQVMVSTNGKGPRMAKLVKDRIAGLFEGVEIDKTVENIGEVRKLLRGVCPGEGLQDIKSRMEWMTQVTDLYTFREWSCVDPQKVVKYFPEMPPSSFEDL